MIVDRKRSGGDGATATSPGAVRRRPNDALATSSSSTVSPSAPISAGSGRGRDNGVGGGGSALSPRDGGASLLARSIDDGERFRKPSVVI